MYKSLLSLALASLTLVTSAAHADTYQLRVYSKGVLKDTSKEPANSGPSTPNHAAFSVRSLDWGDAPSVKTFYVTNHSSEPFAGYLRSTSLSMDWHSSCQGEGPFYLAPGDTCTGIFALKTSLPAGTVISEPIELVDEGGNVVDSLTASGKVGTVALGVLEGALEVDNYTAEGNMRWGGGYVRLGQLSNQGNTPITVSVSSSGPAGLRFSWWNTPSQLNAGESTSFTLLPGEDTVIETNVSSWPAGLADDATYTTNGSYTISAPGVSRSFNITLNLRKN